MTTRTNSGIVTFGWNGSIHDQYFTSNPMELLEPGQYEFMQDSGMLSAIESRTQPVELSLWAIESSNHCLRHGFDTLNISMYAAPKKALQTNKFLLSEIVIDPKTDKARFSHQKLELKKPLYVWLEPKDGWKLRDGRATHPNAERIGKTSSISINLQRMSVTEVGDALPNYSLPEAMKAVQSNSKEHWFKFIAGNYEGKPPRPTDSLLEALMVQAATMEGIHDKEYLKLCTALSETHSGLNWPQEVLTKAFEAMAGDRSLNTAAENLHYEGLFGRALILSGAARATLLALHRVGPLRDGDVPSKAGRDELLAIGLIEKIIVRGEDGYQACNYRGRDVMKALNVLYPDKKL